jgi:hypothetical protein
MIQPLCLLLGISAAGASEAFFVDASLDLDGDLLSWRFLDVDADGKRELLVAVRTPDGERELRVHDMAHDRVEPKARRVVPVLEDVLAWTCADVREEPGRELVLLTKGGAWSYSLTLEGYKDNVARLARVELIYDLPDPRALPYWEYVLPAQGGDQLLLAERDRVSLFVPGAEREYARSASFQAGRASDDDFDADGTRDRSVSLGVETSGLGEPFVEEDARSTATLLSDARSYRAPALVDLDGDGLLDIVMRRGSQLEIFMGRAEGPAAKATRTEEFPEYLRGDDQSLWLRLVDVDGDGDLDLLARLEAHADELENATNKVLVLHNDGKRLLPDKPAQVLRFEAAELALSVTDVDGDGRPDLSVRKFELPSLVDAVTGLEFTFTHLCYLGERRGFARKPALKHEETFDEESVVAVIANRSLKLDCDGDGLADLVEVDLDGRVAIRRMRKSSGFLSGDTWSLERAPWKRFETRGSITSLDVADLNGDGLGDVVSAGERRLTVLLSQKPGRRR